MPVNQEHGSISGDPAEFPNQVWSVILVGAESRLPGSKAALTELCRHYWYPLYAFARRRGHAPHDAQDLTQGFFLHLLEHRALKRADPLKGKFRSFLLASFRNFLADEADRARSLTRGGNPSICVFHAGCPDHRSRAEPPHPLPPPTKLHPPL